MTQQQKQAVHLVWFKRDLRMSDHAPLWQAAQLGAVLPLYVIEPSLLHAPDHDSRHYSFVRESLFELRENLEALGQGLVVRVGEVTEVLTALQNDLIVLDVWAHEETGNGLSYARDRAVRRHFKTLNIPFHEIPNGGVVRRLKSRDEWATIWERRMAAPTEQTPTKLVPLNVELGVIPNHAGLDLPADTRQQIQPGGEAAAATVLDGFLTQRSQGYSRAISSPNTAWEGCSRLSVHLAYGTISMRQVVQATRNRLPHVDSAWRRDLSAFLSRLHWRDHFIQKLEDQPALEFENLFTATADLRPHEPDRALFEAWCAGKTGYPLVDACMRALHATGWINFRMRAMLTSFASYNLWLHWRETALHLARMFADYEPGIHYSQMQMQSGTTGINTLRIYNPTKQAQDWDPEGTFIRAWLPELAKLPGEYIHEPWLIPPLEQTMLDFELGRDYPFPVVDQASSAKAARQLIVAAQQTPEAQEEAKRILLKHGSRKRPNRRR
jgi:deoxyribodipyrimidine photo-lyase